MRVVYLDELLFYNFAVDYLILHAAAEIAGIRIRRRRIAIGAFIGALYGAVTAIFPIEWIRLLPFQLLVMAAMLLVSFGWKSSLIRLSVCYGAVSAAFAGTVMAVSYAAGYPQPETGLKVRPRLLLLSIGVCDLFLTMALKSLKRKVLDGRELCLTVAFRGKSTSVTAIRDTGNRLRDPITGRNVMVVDGEALRTLFSHEAIEVLASDESPEKKLEALQSVQEAAGFTLVPYHTVGESAALMLCFYPDWIEIDGTGKQKGIVGISPMLLSKSRGIQAIVNA